MIDHRIIRDALLGTSFIISIIILFQLVRFIGIFNVLDPIGDAIGDVEITDIVFSEIRNKPEIDKNVILVNIGDLSRRELASQLNIINAYHPAVVGIHDYFWELDKDTIGDQLLHQALSQIEKLVMVNQLVYTQEGASHRSLKCSHPYFNIGHTGYANLGIDAPEKDRYDVCRTFPPKMHMNGNEELAFAVKMCELYDQTRADKFLRRDKKQEIINYRGNVIDFGQSTYGGRYTALDVEDVFQRKFEPELIRGKIVLFGYLGRDFNDRSWEDKFYTPLNSKYAGRSNPDMFEVVIHANIISMILKGDYIGRQSKVAELATALLICFAVVVLFTWIYHRLPQWYDGLTKTIQLILMFLLLTINVLTFHWFNYKISLTLATIMVALTGDSLEICFGLLRNLFSKNKRKLIFRIYNST